MNDPLHFRSHVTASGLTVFHQHRDLPWFICRLAVLAGARHDPMEKPGTAHLLEHVITMGNVGYPRRDFTALQEWCTAQGFDIMWGQTWTEATVYGGKAAVPRAEALLRYLHAIALLPLLESDLEHEIEIIRDERTESGTLREREADRVKGKALFGGHPLSIADTWPEDDILLRMTYDDCRAYHAAHYGCPNMALVVSGGIDEDALLKELERTFPQPDPPFRKPPAQAPPAFGRMPDPRRHRSDKDEGGPTESYEVTYAWLLPRLPQAEARLLGGGLSALLNDRVREKACAAYGVTVEADRLTDCTTLSIVAEVPAGKLRTGRKAIDEALADDAALAAMVEKARREIALATELADDTVEESVSAAVARIVADGAPEPRADALANILALPTDAIVRLKNEHCPLDRAYVELIEH